MQQNLPTPDPANPRNHGEFLSNWREEIMPGCYFVRFLPDQNLVLWGQILPFSQPLNGCVPTICHSDRTYPQQAMTPLDSMALMLSVEQFNLARDLGWPSTKWGTSQVFNLAPN